MVTLPKKQVFTTAEAAQIIGVTPRRIRAMCESGVIHATLLTKRLYTIARADLEAVLRDRKRKGL
jgi:excisionase family DNA binding protein